MPSITVSDESKKIVETYAKQMELKSDEAADRLIGTARSRINALRRYAKKVSEEGAPKTKPKKKPAKKAAKKSAPAAQA